MCSPVELTQYTEVEQDYIRHSPWYRYATREMIRKSPHGTLDTIEPGVRYYVRMLERLGATTLYSCEGHLLRSGGWSKLYVMFSAKYRLAHKIARVCNFSVMIHCNEFYPKDTWVLEDRLSRFQGRRRHYFLSQESYHWDHALIRSRKTAPRRIHLLLPSSVMREPDIK